MRDYLIVGLILVSLPIGVIVPFYGLLTYTWISYMNPHLYAWTFAQTFPVAKLSALSALTGTIVRGAAHLAPLKQPETFSMIVLWGAFTLSSSFAIYSAIAWSRWQDASKLIVMALLTSTLLTNQKRIRYFLLLIAASIGFYGFKGGLFSLLTGGNYMIYGPGDSIIGANNSIGLALNMCLPVFWYLAQEERGWIRWLLRATFLLSIPAIMFTYSRASALTVPIVLLALFAGRGKLLLVLFLIGALLAVPYIPERWWNRQESTLSYQQDRSAMSRIDNWKFVWKVFLDRPWHGAGFDFFTLDTVARYSPEFIKQYGKTWDTHSIYFAMLGAHGLPGFLAFGAMILFCFLSCRKMRKQVRGRPELKWVATYCSMITVSLLAFLVNGAFVNMEYFDLPYHWAAVVASLKVISLEALNAPLTPEVADVNAEMSLQASV